MKSLFTNISQEEKNRILEMHSAKKNVISEQSTPSGTINVPKSKKVVEGMTINLYNDKSESSQPKTYKIINIIDEGSDGIKFELRGKDSSLYNPLNPFLIHEYILFNCNRGGIRKNYKPKKWDDEPVYNKQFETSIKNQFCQKNKQNITVPQADFAMNNQQTDTTTDVA